ncbi:NAD(P)-dependent dehydrogenase, short-chain alcohol dehydrogenase family [Cyclobacterium lianum]|uniref:NAD(P)-dependent dehydrogenase, short-chain alcohol dehydrogenase family n=1 Tax=Cyclobacterium lianum TaxID=388280 RepID=A0A1M7INR4_9BACT|nr:SDR family oxidoreductase [Cyclobacterium lianum]SHM42442.1 NAD(P)-dependent dehydrogenase, short-chain alcohol dehydrogenase family [Cyclobacterium lianum]
MNPNIKTAIITGAGSGIGRAVAQALADDDWTLILAGRKKESLEATARLCTGENHLLCPADITDPADVRQLFLKTRAHFGRLDLLFNNAGVNAPSVSLDELSFADWKMVIDTNLTGAFLCTQEAFKLMREQDPKGGRIINNGSLSAHSPRPQSVAYTASKHAITGLTRSTNLDGRAHDIVCGQIDIGNARSEMTKRIEKGILQADGTHKIEPTMDVAEVGRAVVHMASLPLGTNIPWITLMANGMPYMGRG